MGRVFIGTSGWSYAHWEGAFYPVGLAPSERLGFYQKRFATVELNSSYYQWPANQTFQSWHKRLPSGFTLAVKAPGDLTHKQKLYAPEAWLTRITHGLSYLKEHRGPVLVQVPNTLPLDEPRLRYFLESLPNGHQVALEMRHASWHREDTYALLEQYGVAYCVMSGAHLPCVLRATADFVYVRLHGPSPDFMYAGSYSEDSLLWWSERIWEWRAHNRDVYVYFNNDGEANAVRNALRLRELQQA